MWKTSYGILILEKLYEIWGNKLHGYFPKWTEELVQENTGNKWTEYIWFINDYNIPWITIPMIRHGNILPKHGMWTEHSRYNLWITCGGHSGNSDWKKIIADAQSVIE